MKRRPHLSLRSQAFRQRSVWTRAALVGLPVGCLQALLNQGALWWHHHVNGVVLAKTFISPLVTCSVALISCAATWVEKQQLIRNQAPREDAPTFESSNGNPQTA
jgi:H+/Cl- antiporter ClcA